MTSKIKKPAIALPDKIPGLRKSFTSMPGHFLVLSKDFTIVKPSDVFLENTLTRRDDITGRNIFDVFPSNPNDPSSDGVHRLRASFLSVLEKRTLDIMSLIKYDIPKPGFKNKFIERYWHAVNFPVFDKHGNLAYILHNSEDVTHSVHEGSKLYHQSYMSGI